MPIDVVLTFEDATTTLRAADDAARALPALGRPRRTIAPEVRDRVGAHDGWICRICRRPIDPTLKIVDTPPHVIQEHREHLDQYTAIGDVKAVIGWVGADEVRAAAARRWFDRCNNATAAYKDTETYEVSARGTPRRGHGVVARTSSAHRSAAANMCGASEPERVA